MRQIRKDWCILVRSAALIGERVTLAAACLIALAFSANARGGHESEAASAPSATHSAQFAGGRRHGNNPHIKAAIEERDRLLTTQLKSICKGC
jgi:hypothetical protein